MSFLKTFRLMRLGCMIILWITAGVEQAHAQLFEQKELRLISRQFTFTEGPAVDGKGDVYFTDQPDNKIWKYGTDGKLSLFMDKAGRANGLFFKRSGELLVCADEKDELWSVNRKGSVTVLVDHMDGKKLNGPNDLWADRRGGIYMTDPYYQRDYWTRTKAEMDGEKVYYLPPGGKAALRIAAADLGKPNGIVGSADGKYLFVADIQRNKTYRYRIDNHGNLSNQTIAINQGADGMTIDSRGNFYLAGKGVSVYNPAGVLTGHIEVPEPWTSNVCFGGRDRTQLFITASTAIYVIPMHVKGTE